MSQLHVVPGGFRGMANIRSDFETDFQRFSDMLHWADGIAVLAGEALLILLLFAWWLT